MLLHAASIAALASALSAVPDAEMERPRFDLALQPALSLYLGKALPPACGEQNGCAAGRSLGLQLGVPVTPTMDVIVGLRHLWSRDVDRLDQLSGGLAWWPPTRGVVAVRVYGAAGPILIPGAASFEAHVGGEAILFLTRWLGVGVMGEAGLGWLGALHIGTVIHLRL